MTLNLWRKKSELSQTELAEAIGVSQKTISSWETGKTVPDMRDYEKLRHVLKLKAYDHIILPDE